MTGAKPSLVAIRNMDTLVDTLNAYGAAAVPLDIDSEGFVRSLDVCVTKYFKSALGHYLAQPDPPSPYKDPQRNTDWQNGRNAYILTDDATRVALDAALMNAFDPGTDAGRAALFKNRDRAIHAVLTELGRLDNALAFYLESVLVLVKQGGSRMALGGGNKPVEKWTRSGFGFWAQIVPSQGIQSQLALRQALKDMGFDARLKGLPHAIYKPDGGEILKTHTDGPRLDEMIYKLEEMHAREQPQRWPTNYEWCEAMGLQSLVHYKGGRGQREGATYGIGPMTPHKMYVCLTTLKNSPNEKTRAAYRAAANPEERGPAFLAWETHFEELNDALRRNGMDPIGLMPICPEDSCPGTFAALWPVGYPHGSHKNESRRVTTTAPLSIFRQDQVDGRVPGRIHAFATLADASATAEERAAALAVVAGDTEPFEGGSTHKRPDAAARWYDRQSGAGYFADIAPTRRDAEEFQSVWEQDHNADRARSPPRSRSRSRSRSPSRDHRPSSPMALPVAPPPKEPSRPIVPPFGPAGCDPEAWKLEVARLEAIWSLKGEWPAGTVRPFPNPSGRLDRVPHTLQASGDLIDALNHPSCKFFNVQEPWASLIAAGVKCVENRKNAYMADKHPGGWAVIVASKSNYTKRDWASRVRDYENRLAWSGQTMEVQIQSQEMYNATTAQHAVALVRIECVSNHTISDHKQVSEGTEEQKQSIWNNGDDYAWLIREVFKFPTPVPTNQNGTLGVANLNVPKQADFRAALIGALQNAIEEGRA